MHTEDVKIDQLLQFILLTAGQEDFPHQDLGPIHLIKYLYLADLAYAERNNGQTYTALPWQFHHFGPWTTEAYLRIEPALERIGATKKTLRLSPPKYQEDLVRWSVQNDQLYRELVSELPMVITRTVQKYVHEFHSSTEDLLHCVYTTWPMLRAKPEERLDFTVPSALEPERTHQRDEGENMAKELSVKQKKKRKQALEQLKTEFRERLEAKRKAPKAIYSLPCYDDVFYEGLMVLDSLAGEELQTTYGVARFSEDIWKSPARTESDVS